MQVRPERPGDADQVSEVTTAAFATAAHSGGNEARVIEALRQANALAISLVAVGDEGRIVGHIAFSPVRIDLKPGQWYGLGPVSVLPHLQKTGIGKTLILEGLDMLRHMGAELCVLLGEPDYYRRFGFASDPGLTYLNYPINPYFQRIVLSGDPPKGDVTYHAAFDAE